MQQLIDTYGSWLGLLIYIAIVHGIPFFKDKVWPANVKRREADQLLRREADQRLLDLEERKIVADELIGKHLVLSTERLEKLNGSLEKHDNRMIAIVDKLLHTMAGIQAVQNVLLDRMNRTPETGND